MTVAILQVMERVSLKESGPVGSMPGPTAEDVKMMMKDGRLVNIGEKGWRLLALGPTLDRHHLVEVEKNIWKQVHETDQKFLIRRACERLEQIYPGVWKLVQ
jgi:hypothetical protein